MCSCWLCGLGFRDSGKSQTPTPKPVPAPVVAPVTAEEVVLEGVPPQVGRGCPEPPACRPHSLLALRMPMVGATGSSGHNSGHLEVQSQRGPRTTSPHPH